MKDHNRKIIQFTLLYNKNKQRLFNYVLRMVNDELLTEDIIQNTFLKFFNNLEKIRNQNAAVHWLFTTARNEVFQYYRKKGNRSDEHFPEDADTLNLTDASSLYENYEIKEFGNLLKKELEQLPYEQKEVFVLKEYGGFSYSEIAKLMEITEDLVKSRLYKTRQKLIKKLKKQVA